MVEDSLLERTFSGRFNLKTVKDAVYLDRDPKIFEMLLNYLRHNRNYIPQNVDAETKKLFCMEVIHWGVETPDFIEAQMS